MLKKGLLRVQNYIVTDRSFYQKVLTILIPVLLQSIINQGVNMMDTVMVGQLGEVAISASSLANQYYMLFQLLCMGISAAGLVLTAQYFGRGDLKTVRRVFDLVLQIVVIGGFLFGVVTFLFPEQIMSIYTDPVKNPGIVAAGAAYLRITAFIFIPHGISLVMSNVARSVGNAKLGLYVSVVSFGVNIFCNWVFIFGKFGFAAMGVKGAALGTLCARLVELAVCSIYLLKIEKKLCYRLTHVLQLPSQAIVGEFVRLGLPAVVSDFLIGLAGTVVSVIIGHTTEEIMSAWAIVMVVDRLCTVAIMGVSSASSVVIGQTVGEGETERAKKEGWTFLFLGAAVGLLGSILVLLIGEASIGIYEITEATRLVTVVMMEASAIVVFFQSVQNVLSKGVLRGGGDTKFLMIADVVFQWCASIPLGALVGLVLRLGPFWLIIALRIDYIIKSFWLVFRLKSGKWIHRAKQIEPTT